MNSGQVCRSWRESCSPIPGRGCFGDLPGDKIVVSPPSTIVEPLSGRTPRPIPNYGTTSRRPAPQTTGTHKAADGGVPLIQKGTRPGQLRNRGGICSHPPLPGTRHLGIRPHHLWPPRSSTDYRADAKEVPLDVTQKQRPRRRVFLRMPKAQEVHQPARRHAASLLPLVLGSSRDDHP